MNNPLDKNHSVAFGGEITTQGTSDALLTVGRAAIDGVGVEFFQGLVDDETEFTAGGEPILSGEEFVERATELGFGSGKRGTYHNEDSFLYIKTCHEIQQRDDIDAALSIARQLTQLGAIHPDSSWGVLQNERGYQLFVVSPKLKPWLLEEAIGREYDEIPSRPDEGREHLDAWLKSVDNRYAPGQELPEGSLARYLNQHEASHPDNWGWDSDGKLYPVDVEVINLRTINRT